MSKSHVQCCLTPVLGVSLQNASTIAGNRMSWFTLYLYITFSTTTPTILLHYYYVLYSLEIKQEKYAFLSHDRDTIHAEKGCAEMCKFRMAALLFLTGHGMRARTDAHAEIALKMHLIGKCAISAWAWVHSIILHKNVPKFTGETPDGTDLRSIILSL